MDDASVQDNSASRKPDRRSRLGRVLAWTSAILGVLACVGCAGLAIIMDQTALAGNVYLQAVSSNNRGVAMLLADHYSDDSEANRALYELDLERDLAWLAGATISDVQTSREETLSGQGVTMVRFKWRPAGSNSLPEDAVLRVKTERWLAVTYIRTVEVVRAAP